MTGGLVAMLMVVGAACGGDDDDDDAGSNAATTTTTASDTTPESISDSGTPEELEDYVGLSLEEAEAKAEADGRPTRVVEEDGEKFPVTMDFIENRLNFVVEDGTVTKVTTG
jgi:hypothetical protein